MVKRDAREVPGASCRVTLNSTHSESRGLAWVIGAFLICPCHLPLTIALAATALAGTTAGVLLRAHPLAAGVLITASWAAGTWRGLYEVHLPVTNVDRAIDFYVGKRTLVGKVVALPQIAGPTP